MSLLQKHFFAASLITLFCVFADAQTGANQTATPLQNKIVADENFELNIAQKRIKETDFARSTSIELASENRGSLLVQIGVGVRAERIDVLLRGITGRVTFRGSLDALRRRIEQTEIKNSQISP